jgi:BirA family biotin operon repressor/biotin-[acetyl-CoA-carboxylase] ligase
MMNPSSADRLLGLLAGGPVSRAAGPEAWNGSDEPLARAVTSLTERGYSIQGTDGVYRLAGEGELLLAERIEPLLRGHRFGLPMHTHGRLGSTNEKAAQLAASGTPEGTLVTAEEQTHGRGRQGRAWYSPAGAGLWVSLVLRPSFQPRRATAIPLLGALAIAAGIRQTTNLLPEIRWPNDVYVGHLKLAGVLGESAVEGDRVRFAVLGMGVNVNLSPSSLPSELSGKAGSLFILTGRTWDRSQLLVAILSGLEARYAAYAEGGFEAIRDEFLGSTRLVGRPVDIRLPHSTISGTVLDVVQDGELVVATDAGHSHIRVGEASLRMR